MIKRKKRIKKRQSKSVGRKKRIKDMEKKEKGGKVRKKLEYIPKR